VRQYSAGVANPGETDRLGGFGPVSIACLTWRNPLAGGYGSWAEAFRGESCLKVMFYRGPEKSKRSWNNPSDGPRIM